VFVQASKKGLTITKTLAYYATEVIMSVKKFMIQAPGERNFQTRTPTMLSSVYKGIIITRIGCYSSAWIIVGYGGLSRQNI